MQHTDILLEYNRDQTVKNYGEKLIAAVAKDRSVANQLIGQFPPDSNMQKVVKTPEGQQIIINYLLDQLEATDPTANKQYTQWIARTYAKGGFQVEDLINQVAPLMAKFAACSMKKSIKQQYNTIAWDINQYKDFGSFMDVVEQLPDPDAVPAAAISQEDAGKYKLLTPPGSGCTVVRLIDEKSAGYFGLHKQPNETRWCTRRYGESGNMFDNYNRQGPLFVIIPDVPEHTGERYQFHFESKQFMDEKDHAIRETGIAELAERFPVLTKIFAGQAAQFGILGLMSPEYKAAVRAHAKVAAPELAKLITEKVKTIANPQVTSTSVGFAALNDYGIKLDPEVKAELVALIEPYLIEARDALVSKDGFWSKVVKNLGSERSENKLETFLTTDATLRSLAENSAAGQRIKQIVDGDSSISRKIDASHMQDLLMRDPLFRVIMRMVPRMYSEVLENLKSQMVKENRDYDDNRTGFRRSGPDVTGEEEPHGIFTVVIDGRAWKTATSNEAFRMAANVARKYPNKQVQVKWPNGALNTVKEDMTEQQLDELSKDTIKSYFPKRVQSAKNTLKNRNSADRAGDVKKAERIATQDLPRAMKKLQDPTYGQKGVAEGPYDDDKGITHTRGSLVAKLEALPKGSDDFEWNRIQAIHQLKQGNMLRAKYYMALMKRGEQGVAEGKEELHTQLQSINQKLKLMRGGPVGEPNSMAFVEKRKELLKQKEQILSQLKQGVAEGQLDELSPKTLGSYVNKASKDVGTLGYGLGDIKARPGKYKDSPDVVKSVQHSFDKRINGVEKASNRLSKQQGVAEGFNSKQEVIDHFVRQGKTAAQGAAAWERGWRGNDKKKPNPFDPKYKFKPVDNSRYGEKDLDEGIFGSKAQEEKFEFYLDGCDAHAVKKYLLSKFGSRGWQVFAAGAGTGKTFVTMTPGLYPTDNEAKWDIEANCGQSIAEDDWHSEQVGNDWHGAGNDAKDAWHGASSGGPMVETKSKPLIRRVERKRADDSVETTYELLDINGRTLKTGMSKESALSALKAYKHKQGIKEGRKQFNAANKQDFARLVAISESIKGKKR